MTASERAFELQKLKKMQRSNSMMDLSDAETAHVEAKTQEAPSATVAADQASSLKTQGESTKIQSGNSSKESNGETKTSQDIRDKIFRIQKAKQTNQDKESNKTSI